MDAPGRVDAHPLGRPMTAVAVSLSSTEPQAAVNLTIRLFGELAERLGRELVLQLPPSGVRVGDLRRRLAETLGAAAEPLLRPNVRVCVDQVLAPDSAWVRPGQEVALMPTFSGG